MTVPVKVLIGIYTSEIFLILKYFRIFRLHSMTLEFNLVDAKLVKYASQHPAVSAQMLLRLKTKPNFTRVKLN